MIDVKLTDPMPKQDELDILGVEWRTKLMVRYGFSQKEAYELALALSGVRP